MSNRRPRYKAARGTFQRGGIFKQKVEAASVAIGIIKDTKQQVQTALNVISLSQKILFLLEFLGDTWKLIMFEDDRYHHLRFFSERQLKLVDRIPEPIVFGLIGRKRKSSFGGSFHPLKIH